MKAEGNLLKMTAKLDKPVKYSLPLGENNIPMNQFIGKKIGLEFQNQINCVKCGKGTKKSFAQGFCYPCFLSAPETEECVLKPELCKAHEGIARDMDFAKQHCLIEHFVYLSLTSSVKVGVTRNTQIPTRWIDQGAVKAIKLAITPNRYLAGLIEVALKAHMADKTNWRNMLKNVYDQSIDLVLEKQKTRSLVPADLQQYVVDDDAVAQIHYPVERYPEKVKSLNFDKTGNIEGVLTGIKGQYLLFEEGSVLNIRKFGGYYLKMSG